MSLPAASLCARVRFASPSSELRACAAAEWVGRLAVRNLYRELALYPKPGLVSPVDSGSHDDMSVETFYRSLFALRHFFPAIALAGLEGAEFGRLRALGRQAEREMLRATGGVNTHRGAIFNLGLLCAVAVPALASGEQATAAQLCARVSGQWGAAIRSTAERACDSHGIQVTRRYGAGGARAQAAAGFPDVIHGALPAYRSVLDATGAADLAAVQALFALMARLDDSNLLWRGGPDGLRFVQTEAARFLEAGGVLAADWESRALHIHRRCVAGRISPGGSADLLAVTLFLHDVTTRLRRDP